MGKAAAILGVSAGGATLTAGGNYMLGDPIGEALGATSKTSDESSSEILSEAEEDVENAGNKHCLDSYFSGLNIEHERDDLSQGKNKGLSRTKKIESSFFNFSEGDVIPKSCLFVHGTKDKDDSTGKWEGDFSGLWTLAWGNKGIVWQVSASTTGKVGNSLKLSGVVYFLKKEGESWGVYKYKDLKSTSTLAEKMDKNNFNTRFPSAGTGITEKDSFGADKDNWGFMSGVGDFENIQPLSDSSSASQTWFKGHWEWESSSESNNTKKLTDWSQNSHQGIREIYQESTIIAKTKSIFENMKGNGIKKSMSGSQITAS